MRLLPILGTLWSLTGCGGLDVTHMPDDSTPSGLPTGCVVIGEAAFQVEIADTPAARTRGLMNRTTLAADTGMLFVFDEPHVLSFWMLNTPIPLDIAFIRADLTISSIDSMQPFSLESHVSVEAVPFALEVPAGEFSRRGIGPEDTISIEREK